MIRNIVFDIGNVIVRWDPALIVARTFGPNRGTPEYAAQLFGAPIWKALNRGEHDEAEAKSIFIRDFGLSVEEADAMFFHVKDSQDLIPGTLDLMEALAAKGYRLFALSDNVHEIVAHLKTRYDFWRYFEGAAISAELGVMKPSAGIFEYLLEAYDLAADETLFFDDVPANVEGARSVGIQACLFTTAEQAAADMRELGILVD